jgi:ribonuclease HI
LESLSQLEETLVLILKKGIGKFGPWDYQDYDNDKSTIRVLGYSETLARQRAGSQYFVRDFEIGRSLADLNDILRRDWNRLDPNSLINLSTQERPIILYKNKAVNSIYETQIPPAFSVFEVFTDASYCNLYNVAGDQGPDSVGVAGFSLVGVSEANIHDPATHRIRTYSHLVPFYISSSTEAEIYAIYVATRVYQGKYLIINTDSQEALQTIAINGIMPIAEESIGYRRISHYINEIRKACFERNIVLTWLPSHREDLALGEFNAIADELAKEALKIIVPRCLPYKLEERWQSYRQIALPSDIFSIKEGKRVATPLSLSESNRIFSLLIQAQQAIHRMIKDIKEFQKTSAIKDDLLPVIMRMKWLIDNDTINFKNTRRSTGVIMPDVALYLIETWESQLWPPFVEEKDRIYHGWKKF